LVSKAATIASSIVCLPAQPILLNTAETAKEVNSSVLIAALSNCELPSAKRHSKLRLNILLRKLDCHKRSFMATCIGTYFMATKTPRTRKAKAEKNDGRAVEPMPHVEALQSLRILVRAAQRHSSWIETQCSVPGAQLWLMQELQDEPGISVRVIAEKMAIHQTTVSNMLDTLEKRGLITRRRDSSDQRVVKLALTKDGAALLAKAPTPARGLLPEALSRMDAKSLDNLNNGLRALIGVISMGEEMYGLQPLPFTM